MILLLFLLSSSSPALAQNGDCFFAAHLVIEKSCYSNAGAGDDTIYEINWFDAIRKITPQAYCGDYFDSITFTEYKHGTEWDNYGTQSDTEKVRQTCEKTVRLDKSRFKVPKGHLKKNKWSGERTGIQYTLPFIQGYYSHVYLSFNILEAICINYFVAIHTPMGHAVI